MLHWITLTQVKMESFSFNQEIYASFIPVISISVLHQTVYVNCYT